MYPVPQHIGTCNVTDFALRSRVSHPVPTLHTHTHRTCATVSGYRSGLDTTHCRTSVSHSEYLQLSPQQQPKESLSPGRTARAVTSLVVRSSLVSHFPMHATTLLVSRIWALIARQRSASPQARAPDSCSLPVSAKASQGKLRQPLHRDLADGHCVFGARRRPRAMETWTGRLPLAEVLLARIAPTRIERCKLRLAVGAEGTPGQRSAGSHRPLLRRRARRLEDCNDGAEE